MMLQVGWVWTNATVGVVTFAGGLDLNTQLYGYLHDTVYVATPSTDLTTLLARRLNELTGEATARFKTIIAAAGASN